MVAAQRMCKRCGNVPPIDGEKFAPTAKKLTLTELREALGPIHTRTIYDSGPNTKAARPRRPPSLVICLGGRGMTTPSPHEKRLDYENVHEPKPPAPTTLLMQAAGSMPLPLAVTLGTEPITDQQAYERFLDAQDEAHKQREAMNARAAQHAREPAAVA